MHSNPSRIQSKISVLTEIEVTLQSIQDTEYLHKTQTKFRKNSHECCIQENDWSFQDSIHENPVVLQHIRTFCKRFQRCWQSTTLASEPRVSDTPTILEPLWDYSMNLAATQPVDCKKENYVTSTPGLTLQHSHSSSSSCFPASSSHTQVVLNATHVSSSINSSHQLLSIADGSHTIGSPQTCQMSDLVGTVARRAECPLLMGPSVLCKDANTLAWGGFSGWSRWPLPSRRLRAKCQKQ